MKFLTSVDEDISGIDAAITYQIIRPCPFIAWPWHSDKRGCFLLLDKITNDHWHVYNDQSLARDINGMCIADMLRMIDNNYEFQIRHYVEEEEEGEQRHPQQDTLPRVAENCLTVDLLQRTAQGQSLYLTENTTFCVPKTRFAVNLGRELTYTFGAFNTRHFGLATFTNMHIIATKYIDEILPHLNDTINIKSILATNREEHQNIILNHLLPEQLFDAVVPFGGAPLFLRPCSIVRSWQVFLEGWRNQIMGVVRSLAASSMEEVKALICTQDKLREKKICAASTFISSRSVVQEFRCSAKTAADCPHIRNAINKQSKLLVLSADVVLCQFLLYEYLQNYDDGVVNNTFGFKCQFAVALPSATGHSHVYNRNIDHAHANVSIFQGLVGRHSNLHRMCIPQRYLTIDWFRWTLKLLNIEIE